MHLAKVEQPYGAKNGKETLALQPTGLKGDAEAFEPPFVPSVIDELVFLPTLGKYQLGITRGPEQPCIAHLRMSLSKAPGSKTKGPSTDMGGSFHAATFLGLARHARLPLRPTLRCDGSHRPRQRLYERHDGGGLNQLNPRPTDPQSRSRRSTARRAGAFLPTERSPRRRECE